MNSASLYVESLWIQVILDIPIQRGLCAFCYPVPHFRSQFKNRWLIGGRKGFLAGCVGLFCSFDFLTFLTGKRYFSFVECSFYVREETCFNFLNLGFPFCSTARGDRIMLPLS